MIYYTNECCDCGLPCSYEACRYYKVKHFKCDECGKEDVELYRYNDGELCADCILKEFEVVDDSDEW